MRLLPEKLELEWLKIVSLLRRHSQNCCQMIIVLDSLTTVYFNHDKSCGILLLASLKTIQIQNLNFAFDSILSNL